MQIDQPTDVQQTDMKGHKDLIHLLMALELLDRSWSLFQNVVLIIFVGDNNAELVSDDLCRVEPVVGVQHYDVS